MHWKRGAKKERKSVEWGSPKYLQPNREHPNLHRGKRKRGVCTKTGQPHAFVVESMRVYTIIPTLANKFSTLRCKDCKRSKVVQDYCSPTNQL